MSRRWWWTTLLVIAGIILLAWLGFWQLDRLEQRRADNVLIEAQLSAPPLDLNTTPPTEAEHGARYREVVVTGTLDISRQVFLVQQRYNERLGQHLIAPLQIAGTNQAVLIDRGWIPGGDDNSPEWPDFPVSGEVVIKGFIQPTETLSGQRDASLPSPDNPQKEWFRVDVEAIQAQVPYALLPFYILQAPETNNNLVIEDLPYRIAPEIDLSDGPHLSYALQWFTFSLMLGFGYIYFVNKESAAGPRKH